MRAVCRSQATMGIVGEPTSMRLAAAHKGKVAIPVQERGQEGLE